MEFIDFVPKMHEEISCFCCFEYETNDTVEIIKKRMNRWIEKNRDTISVINIETLDYYYNRIYYGKLHLRVWYKKLK